MDKISNNISNSQAEEGFFVPSESLKRIEVGFSATEVSPFGGLVMIMAQEQNVKFLSELAARITDWRNPGMVEHTIKEMVTQRVLQIVAGYEDADDCDILRNDHILKLAVGRLPSDGALCSQPSMSRLENHVGHKDLYEIGKLFVKNFLDSYDTPPRQIILDLDDSNSNTYGCQQLSLFNDYYGEYCYMPLFAFEGYSGRMILPMLRPGRTNKRINVFGFVRRLVRAIHRRWRKTVIIVRGDAMFSSSELMEWICNGSRETRRVHFVLGMTGYKVLKDRVAVAYDHMRCLYCKTHEKQKTYRRILYRAERWKQAQWLAVKIEWGEKGGNIRFVATDLYWKDPKRLYEHYYCKRGDCERFIREMKDGVMGDRMSCGSFSANQFRLFLHGAAYVLMHQSRLTQLNGTDLQDATFIRIRERIILSPVIVTELRTKVKLEFSDKHPYRQVIASRLRPAAKAA